MALALHEEAIQRFGNTTCQEKEEKIIINHKNRCVPKGVAPMDRLQMLQGKQVEVVYQGIIYKGKLVGASESEIYLQTLNDWVTLPMEDVTDVREG